MLKNVIISIQEIGWELGTMEKLKLETGSLFKNIDRISNSLGAIEAFQSRLDYISRIQNIDTFGDAVLNLASKFDSINRISMGFQHNELILSKIANLGFNLEKYNFANNLFESFNVISSQFDILQNLGVATMPVFQEPKFFESIGRIIDISRKFENQLGIDTQIYFDNYARLVDSTIMRMNPCKILPHSKLNELIIEDFNDVLDEIDDSDFQINADGTIQYSTGQMVLNAEEFIERIEEAFERSANIVADRIESVKHYGVFTLVHTINALIFEVRKLKDPLLKTLFVAIMCPLIVLTTWYFIMPPNVKTPNELF